MDSIGQHYSSPGPQLLLLHYIAVLKELLYGNYTVLLLIIAIFDNYLEITGDNIVYKHISII